MIKAIETMYNGYRFRSRLEARWAVFFDAMGIKYEYESEGYDLGALGWYLPDFWLPDAKWHVEVKPENVDPNELKRAQYFDNNPPGDSMGVIFLIGQPTIPSTYDSVINSTIWLCYQSDIPMTIAGYNEIVNAVTLARQARFEHGETPVIR